MADCAGTPVMGQDEPDVVSPISGVTVTTLAGAGTSGTANGAGAVARFDNPVNVYLSPPSTLFVADFDNGLLRKATTAGAVTTLTDQAGFARPFGITAAANGDLIVETDYDETGVDAGLDGGVIWTVDPMSGEATTLLTMAGRPRGLARMPNGAILMSDIFRHDLRLLDVGTAVATPLAGKNDCPGYVDGTGAAARFNRPYGVVVTPVGDVLVADQLNNVIRRVTAAGEVSTYAGDGVADMIDGPLATARFNQPQDLAMDAAGNIFVSDLGNHRVRVIGIDNVVRTVAGNGTAGFADGAGTAAQFFGMEGLAVTADGKTIYLADGTGGDVLQPYHRLRKITLP
jgi:sugar lactone lactonase YvrE